MDDLLYYCASILGSFSAKSILSQYQTQRPPLFSTLISSLLWKVFLWPNKFFMLQSTHHSRHQFLFINFSTTKVFAPEEEPFAFARHCCRGIKSIPSAAAGHVILRRCGQWELQDLQQYSKLKSIGALRPPGTVTNCYFSTLLH